MLSFERPIAHAFCEEIPENPRKQNCRERCHLPSLRSYGSLPPLPDYLFSIKCVCSFVCLHLLMKRSLFASLRPSRSQEFRISGKHRAASFKFSRHFSPFATSCSYVRHFSSTSRIFDVINHFPFCRVVRPRFDVSSKKFCP